jgi:opacity protein-like surface antigen
MRKLLLSIIFSAFVLAGFSQKYLPGYILTNEGDTIHGELLKQRKLSARNKCIFKDLNGEINTFLPNQIIEYRFTDGSYYISMELEENGSQKQVFIQFLLKGIVELYYYPTNGKGKFYIEKEGKLIELANNEKRVIINGSEYQRFDNEYIGILKYLYSDAPEVIRKIDNLSFTPNEMVKISEKYHNYVCEDESCEIYISKFKTPHFGIKPIFNISFTSIDIQRNETVHYWKDDYVKHIEYSKNYKSDFSFSYGLGLSAHSNDKSLKLEYSLVRVNMSFSDTDYPALFLDSKRNNTTLFLKTINQEIKLSYSFIKEKPQPFISIGANFGSIREALLKEEDAKPKIFPGSYSGFLFEAGLRYTIDKRIFIELCGRYSVYSGSDKSHNDYADFLNVSTIKINYKQIAVQLGINYYLTK